MGSNVVGDLDVLQLILGITNKLERVVISEKNQESENNVITTSSHGGSSLPSLPRESSPGYRHQSQRHYIANVPNPAPPVSSDIRIRLQNPCIVQQPPPIQKIYPHWQRNSYLKGQRFPENQYNYGYSQYNPLGQSILPFPQYPSHLVQAGMGQGQQNNSSPLLPVQPNSYYMIPPILPNQFQTFVSSPPLEALLSPYYSLVYSFRDHSHNGTRNAALASSFASLPFPTQLHIFWTTLSITSPALQQRQQLLQDLSRTLIFHFPFCKIYPFGSFLTELGDDSSDIDVYVDVLGGKEKLPPGWTSLDILDTCLLLLTRSILRFPDGRVFKGICANVEAHRAARVPIIKFTHWNGVNCDLSFENCISRRNSEMISLYIRLHPLVRPLLVVIRYWAAYHGLIGSRLIKSYCIVLLVLTYLQKRSIVPSVAELQDEASAEGRKSGRMFNTDVVEGWDTSFPTDDVALRSTYHPSIPQETNPVALFGPIFLEILQDFFLFYSTDLSSVVVSPYFGKLPPRSIFTRVGAAKGFSLLGSAWNKFKSLMDGRIQLGTNSSLVVQDPFVLNFNVSRKTPSSALKKFQVACSAGVVLVQHQLEKKNGEPRSLFHLFQPL